MSHPSPTTTAAPTTAHAARTARRSGMVLRVRPDRLPATNTVKMRERAAWTHKETHQALLISDDPDQRALSRLVRRCIRSAATCPFRSAAWRVLWSNSNNSFPFGLPSFPVLGVVGKGTPANLIAIGRWRPADTCEVQQYLYKGTPLHPFGELSSVGEV